MNKITIADGADGSLSKLETFNVTIATPTGASTPMYSINTVLQGDVLLTIGFTYRFDTSDSTNAGYTTNVLFAQLPGGSQASLYTTNVTFATDASSGNVISPGT